MSLPGRNVLKKMPVLSLNSAREPWRKQKLEISSVWVNNTKAVGSIPLWAIHASVGLDDPCDSLFLFFSCLQILCSTKYHGSLGALGCREDIE